MTTKKRTYTPEQKLRKLQWQRSRRGLKRDGRCQDCGVEVGPRTLRCTDCADKRIVEYGYEYRLRNKHGITVEQYTEMIEAQDGRCAICGTTEPKGRGLFHVDHCHDTGVIRGLLCMPCNTNLGVYEKNREAIFLYLDR